jgi:hypothetical protein
MTHPFHPATAGSCMHTYTPTHTETHTQTHIHPYTHRDTHADTHERTQRHKIQTHPDTYTHTNTHKHTHHILTSTHPHADTYAHTHTNVHINTQTHTHPYTHKQINTHVHTRKRISVRASSIACLSHHGWASSQPWHASTTAPEIRLQLYALWEPASHAVNTHNACTLPDAAASNALPRNSISNRVSGHSTGQ